MNGDTILILGSEQDEHALAVREELLARGHEARLVDSSWFPQAMQLWFDPRQGSGILRLPGGEEVELTAVRSVYWRSYAGVGEADLPDAEQAWIAHHDSRSLFESLLVLVPARWVNGWEGFRLHQTKPVQLRRVAQLGVPVPSTLLGNDAQAVRQFARQYERCIVKPVQGGDYTVPLRSEELTPERLGNLRFAPITVQEEIAGTNIRVFVAGERVFACEVRTAELDYRADSQPELLVHPLPADIAAMCRQIARELALVWAGIDFRLTADGRYVFLEANPSPMFLGFEAQTGLPLLEILIALLVGAEGGATT